MKTTQKRLTKLIALTLALVLMLPMLSGCSDVTQKIKYFIGWKNETIPIRQTEIFDDGIVKIKYEDGYVKKLHKQDILANPLEFIPATNEDELAVSLYGSTSNIDDTFRVGWKTYESVRSVVYPILLEYLDKVEIPTSIDGVAVTEISAFGFYGATALTSVSIPDSITRIGSFAFSGCSALTTVGILKGVAEVDYGAFSNCPSLTSFKVSADNPNLCAIDNDLYDKNAFTLIQYAAGKKDTVYIAPDSVTRIAAGAFSDAKNLTEITVPSLETTDDGGILDDLFSAHYFQMGISSNILGNELLASKYVVYNMSDWASSYQSDFAYLRTDAGSAVGDSAFYSSSLGGYTISSKDITSTDGGGNSLFYLLSANNLNSLNRIEYQLKKVTLTKATKLHANSFSSWKQLEEISLPQTLVSIGDNCFSNCSSLQSIVFAGTVEQWNAIEKSTAWNANLSLTSIQCSNGSVDLIATE